MLGDDAEFVRDVGDQESLLLERRKRVFDVVASASGAKDSDVGGNDCCLLLYVEDQLGGAGVAGGQQFDCAAAKLATGVDAGAFLLADETEKCHRGGDCAALPVGHAAGGHEREIRRRPAAQPQGMNHGSRSFGGNGGRCAQPLMA